MEETPKMETPAPTIILVIPALTPASIILVFKIKNLTK
jgi:hypothetical protein